MKNSLSEQKTRTGFAKGPIFLELSNPKGGVGCGMRYLVPEVDLEDIVVTDPKGEFNNCPQKYIEHLRFCTSQFVRSKG